MSNNRNERRRKEKGKKYKRKLSHKIETAPS